MERLRAVLVAEEAAGVQALKVVAEGHDLVAVLTTTPQGARAASVHDVAGRRGLPVWPSHCVKEAGFAAVLRRARVDLLLSVHSLHIVHPEILRASRLGSFNLHPGPLPDYAGLNAPSWAIFHGERSHAVTLHWMAAGIDTGDIAYEARFDLSDTDTGLSVSARCVRDGIPLIRRLLAAAPAGRGAIPARPQDLSRRRLFLRSEVPYGGRLRWDLTAREIDAFVRAACYYPLPSPWDHPAAVVEGRSLGVIHVARTGIRADAAPGTVRREGNRLLVAAADEWIALLRVRCDGRYVDAAAL